MEKMGADSLMDWIDDLREMAEYHSRLSHSGGEPRDYGWHRMMLAMYEHDIEYLLTFYWNKKGI